MTIWRIRISRWEHTLRICNTYCFCTAAVVARTRLSDTWYVHCLSCWIHSDARIYLQCTSRNAAVLSLPLPSLPSILDSTSVIYPALFYLLFSCIFSYLPHTCLHFFTFFISFHVIIIRSAAIFTPETLKADPFYFRKLCENDGGSSFFFVLHESGILKVFSHSSEWNPLFSRNEVF